MIKLIWPLGLMATSAYVPLKVCTIMYTVRFGLAAAGRVPSRFALAPLALICLAAPTRWTIPTASLYHAGAMDPNPALKDQFAEFGVITLSALLPYVMHSKETKV